tara:strand:- start:896 stop:1555 length:660 start_codon:yes stop_codon:yes gene_type:complete
MMNKLQEKVSLMQKKLHRAKDIYDFMNKRFSVNQQIVLWRFRYRAIYLFSAMGLWITQNPDEMVKGATYGKTIKEWRNSSKVGTPVTRVILMTLSTQPKATLAELEVLCAPYGKRTALKKLLKEGVELGLLRSTCEGYEATELLIDESFDRVNFKILDDNIVEFCEFVVMFKNMRENAQSVGELEKQNRLYPGRKNLSEDIFDGALDDIIFGGASDDQT